MDDQEEFELQLALEKEEERKQEQGYIYTDPQDGTVYEWDDEKQAWFPKVDEDFLAAYHANYGIYPTQADDQATAATTAPAVVSTPKPAPMPTTAPSRTAKPDAVQAPLQRVKAKLLSSQGSGSVEASLMRAKREAELGIPAPVLDATLADGDAEQQKGGKRKKEEPTWFEMEESRNTNVYVSGLPTENFTDEHFVTLMSKCGIIMVHDEETNEPKIKLYRDADGNLKGDGRCCYLKSESVALAIQLLDDSEFDGNKIHVERAKFTMKGDFKPALKKKKKKPNKKKKPGQKNSNLQDKLLDWRPDNAAKKKRYEQVVIIKHVFHPDEFDEDAMLINEIKDDMQAECSKYGEVKKVMIFDRHPDGVASVKFKDGEGADVCVEALNGRWFAKRQLIAEIWDGNTDYKVEETDKERDQRLKKWENFLDDNVEEGDKKETQSTSEEAGTTIESANIPKDAETMDKVEKKTIQSPDDSKEGDKKMLQTQSDPVDVGVTESVNASHDAEKMEEDSIAAQDSSEQDTNVVETKSNDAENPEKRTDNCVNAQNTTESIAKTTLDSDS